MNKVISMTCTRCRQDIRFCDCDRKQPKRKPLPDGTLPLTESEFDKLRSFYNMCVDDIITKVTVNYHHIEIEWVNQVGHKQCSNTYMFKAILWLAERFDMEV